MFRSRNQPSRSNEPGQPAQINQPKRADHKGRQERRVRIGVIANGHILREQVLECRSDVSIGTRADATVQLSAGERTAVPDYLEVLRVQNDGYFLVLPTDPRARIQLRGTDGGNPVVEVRGRRCVPVEHTSGGSVSYGDLLVMFQFVRADARPTLTRERTVLRIGLVHADRLISDRVYVNRKRVRIGRDKGCDVVLDADYEGPALTFRNGNDGSFELEAAADVDTRLALVDAAPRGTAQLIEAGIARRRGDQIRCHLPLGSRGRARMGPYTVLYQVIRQRIVVPVVESRTLVARIGGWVVNDIAWSTSFAIAALLVGAVVGQAMIYQATTGIYEQSARAPELVERGPIEVEIFERDEPEPPKVAPAAPLAPAAKVEPDKPDKPDKRDRPDKPAKKARRESPEAAREPPQSTGATVDPAARKRNARAGAMAKTIAGGFGRNGARSRLWADAGDDPNEVAGTRFAGTGGADTSPGQTALAIPHGVQGQTAERVRIARPTGFDRGRVAATVAPPKHEPVVKIEFPPPVGGENVVGGKGVGAIISRKATAVRRCYETALRSNPGLGGKVSVRFTVGTGGTVTAVRILGAAGAFASCIESKFRAIRGLPILSRPTAFTQSYVFTKE